jgi:predicted nucleic acid-binding protein
MLAIDTNVIIRYLTGDHPRQSARARTLIEREDVFVATTVLLETEWVLRSVYEFSRSAVFDALAAFAGLPRVTLEAPALVAEAIEWARRGIDFADALHLVSAKDCAAFGTFDEKFARAAKHEGQIDIRLL